MRVMFSVGTLFSTIIWENALSAIDLDYVKRTIWDDYGNVRVFIVSESSWDYIKSNTWVEVNYNKWWTITSCNKQYITEYELSGNGIDITYLGCLKTVNRADAEDHIKSDNAHFYIEGGGMVWIPYTGGSPSRIIRDYSSTPEVSLKSEENWPVGPAAPVTDHSKAVEEQRELVIKRLKWMGRLSARINREVDDLLDKFGA